MSADGQKVIEGQRLYLCRRERGSLRRSDVSERSLWLGSRCHPVMEKLKEAHIEAVNANAEVKCKQSDSTTGMTMASEGTCDIGMASRELRRTRDLCGT